MQGQRAEGEEGRRSLSLLKSTCLGVLVMTLLAEWSSIRSNITT